jgi:hypothetical protein
MRPELEQIERIEQWLDGRLNSSEKATFEQLLAVDKKLQEEVQLQRDLRKGLERIHIKEGIGKAKTRFKTRRTLKWGLGGLAILLIALLVIFLTQKTRHAEEYSRFSLPELNEAGEKSWVDADSLIRAQNFIIDGSADTVIETKGGMVLAIQANSFIDDKGNPVNEDINLVIKEALDPSTILSAGLSTTSGDQLLETGGMFFIDARRNGKTLSIDGTKKPYIEIPTSDMRTGMQLFKGKRLVDGSIDWIEPTSLETALLPVEITTLDFYPPGYLNLIKDKGYNPNDKMFTDSLYYSLAASFDTPVTNDIPEIQNDTTVKTDSAPALIDKMHMCGINPSKIKAIWNGEFQNTLLATREFEERLRFIHFLGDEEVLDFYVENLDKPLYIIDSMLAATTSSPEIASQFLSYARRKNGKVNINAVEYRLLNEYYKNKSRAYTEAVTKTQKEYWDRQVKANQEGNRKTEEHQNDSINKVLQNINEEFLINLKDTYRQLGYDTAIKPAVAQFVYSAAIPAAGWYNIDKYVLDATNDRTTGTFTDPKTRRSASIEYQPFSIDIVGWADYDNLFIYLLPDKLSSFQRIAGSSGKYTESLNRLIQYDLVCIGYKGRESYLFKKEKINAGHSTNIELLPINDTELSTALNATDRRLGTEVKREIEFIHFEIEERKRKIAHNELNKLRLEVAFLISRCETESDYELKRE